MLFGSARNVGRLLYALLEGHTAAARSGLYLESGEEMARPLPQTAAKTLGYAVGLLFLCGGVRKTCFSC